MAGRACLTMSNACTMMFPCANTAPLLQLYSVQGMLVDLCRSQAIVSVEKKCCCEVVTQS